MMTVLFIHQLAMEGNQSKSILILMKIFLNKNFMSNKNIIKNFLENYNE